MQNAWRVEKNTEFRVESVWRYTKRLIGEKTRMVSELEVTTDLGWSGIMGGLWIPDSGSAEEIIVLRKHYILDLLFTLIFI